MSLPVREDGNSLLTPELRLDLADYGKDLLAQNIRACLAGEGKFLLTLPRKVELMVLYTTVKQVKYCCRSLTVRIEGGYGHEKGLLSPSLRFKT